MTLLSEIIQQSYRDGNLIPIGTDPSTNEIAEGLKRLQVLIGSALGNEAGEKLAALPLGNNNIAAPQGWPSNTETWATRPLPINVRLICNLSSPLSVNAPIYPQDGSRMAAQDESANFTTNNLTIVGNGRLVEGATSVTLSTNSERREWFYRADLGDWKRITSLASTDEMPYPEEFDDLFVTMLALRLNPRNSQSLSKESAAAMERSREQFRSRYSQIINTPADLATRNLSRQTYNNFYAGRGNINNGWMV